MPFILQLSVSKGSHGPTGASGIVESLTRSAVKINWTRPSFVPIDLGDTHEDRRVSAFGNRDAHAMREMNLMRRIGQPVELERTV